MRDCARVLRGGAQIWSASVRNSRAFVRDTCVVVLELAFPIAGNSGRARWNIVRSFGIHVRVCENPARLCENPAR